MLAMASALRARVVLAALVALTAIAPAAEPPREGCDGCRPSSTSTGASGGICVGMVELTVVLGPGDCDWLWNGAVRSTECRQRRGCSSTITRSWRELPPEIEIDYCVGVDGRELCLWPRPTSGRGWGSSTRTGPRVPCDDDGSIAFAASNIACDLHARGTMRCAGCSGRM